MILRSITIVFLILVSHITYAQNNFLNVYDYGSYGMVFHDVTQHNDTIVALALLPDHHPSDSTLLNSLLVCRYDTLGTLIDSFQIWDPNKRHFANESSSYYQIISLDNLDAYVISANIYLGGIATICISKLGTILWTNEFTQTNSLNIKSMGLLETSDGIVGASRVQFDAHYKRTKPYIVKYDYSGQEQWRYIVEDGLYHRNVGGFTSITRDIVGNIIVGIGTSSSQNMFWPNISSGTRIITFDTLGNKLEDWSSIPNDDGNVPFGLHQDPEGNWRYYATRYFKVPDTGAPTWTQQPKFFTRNSDFEIVDTFNLGINTRYYNQHREVIWLSDGSFLGVGESSVQPDPPIHDQDYSYLWMQKIDPSGFIHWERKDIIHPDSMGRPRFRSVVELSSGSLVAVGVRTVPLIGYKPVGVMMKITSDGCFTPDDCGIPVYEPAITSSTKELPPEESELNLTISPNPNSGNFMVELPKASRKPQVLNVFSEMGYSIKTIEVPPGQKHIFVQLVGGTNLYANAVFTIRCGKYEGRFVYIGD